eukprot:SAG11_NODE_29616_length_303_cov_0.728571_1_plen_49_part_10
MWLLALYAVALLRVRSLMGRYLVTNLNYLLSYGHCSMQFIFKPQKFSTT